MFLVATQRHEQWTTSGKFHLRFLRQVPVSDKRCTARMEGPFAGPIPSPTASDTDSTEEPGSSIHRPVIADDVDEEQKVGDRATGASASLPAQSSSPIPFKDTYYVPLNGRTANAESDEESTHECDYGEIDAAALEKFGGDTIPLGIFPPPK